MNSPFNNYNGDEDDLTEGQKGEDEDGLEEQTPVQDEKGKETAHPRLPDSVY